MIFQVFHLYQLEKTRQRIIKGGIKKRMKKKTILFLSALDFKEKSIQVIRKTPEAYRDADWNVHYVVARDTSRHGNYFYEQIINVDGIQIYRFNFPLQTLRDLTTSRYPQLLLTRFIVLLTIFRLAWVGAKILRNTKVDVIYGYEIQGVWAMQILKFFRLAQNAKRVSRFQGTFLNEMIEAKQYARMLFNYDLCFALWWKSNLCIMTNDGTEGDKAVKKIKSRNLEVFKFWVNGVDHHTFEASEVAKIRKQIGMDDGVIFLSVSRLVGWKRVDRALKALAVLKSKYNIIKFKYWIVGEGQEKEKLEKLAIDLGIGENVFFIGAVSNLAVKNYLEAADYFISTYDSSNVGNPLLEAIRASKIIFTLRNGDTGSWIEHGVNGFIYNVDEKIFESMAYDMSRVIQDEKLRHILWDGVKHTSRKQLWTWSERFKAELEAVSGL